MTNEETAERAFIEGWCYGAAQVGVRLGIATLTPELERMFEPLRTADWLKSEARKLARQADGTDGVPQTL